MMMRLGEAHRRRRPFHGAAQVGAVSNAETCVARRVRRSIQERRRPFPNRALTDQWRRFIAIPPIGPLRDAALLRFRLRLFRRVGVGSSVATQAETAGLQAFRYRFGDTLHR